MTVSCSVKNTGAVDGTEIAQLYLVRRLAQNSLRRPQMRPRASVCRAAMMCVWSVFARQAFPASAGEPPLVLRGFQKLHIAAGSSAKATFMLVAGDMSVWDATKHDWTAVSGKFGVSVGASSRDIRLTGSVTHSPAPGQKVKLFE